MIKYLTILTGQVIKFPPNPYSRQGIVREFDFSDTCKGKNEVQAFNDERNLNLLKLAIAIWLATYSLTAIR